MTEYYLGTMGFSYEDWKGVFYLSGSPARDYLEKYSRIFNSVEMDTTFYAIPRKDVVEGWAAAVPEQFCFTVKTTTDFLYIRWLGKHAAFRRYDHEQLDRSQRLAWCLEQIQNHISVSKKVYGFFNNDYSGFAPATCNQIKTLLHLPTVDFQQPVQGRLF